MSLRPAPPKAQGAFGVVAAPRRAVAHAKASRLDEVLATGVVYGTPVAYGLATQQDKALTRSLKDASLGDATGAPCVPLSFDPDYCKRFDKFYALGLAVASSVATWGAGVVAEFSHVALERHITQTLQTECNSKSWTSYIRELVRDYSGYDTTLQFCTDLENAYYSNSAVHRDLEFWSIMGVASTGRVLLPLGILAQVIRSIVLGATQTGWALYTKDYRGLGDTYPQTTAHETLLVAAAIKLVASKVDEFARGIASYLRMNMRLWLRGGLRALKSSPYLNPFTFVRMVRYDILHDDDDDDARQDQNTQVDPGELSPPPLEQGSPSYREYVPPPDTPPGLRRFSSGVDGIAE